jgi:hypothetical protein
MVETPLAPPAPPAPDPKETDGGAPDAATAPQERAPAADLVAGCTATTAPQPSAGQVVEVRVDVRASTAAERKQAGSDSATVVAVVTAPSLGASWVVFADGEPAGCSNFVRGDGCLSFTCHGDMQSHPVLIRADGGQLTARDQMLTETHPAADTLAGPSAAPRPLRPEQAHVAPLPPGAAVRFKVSVAKALQVYSSPIPAGL